MFFLAKRVLRNVQILVNSVDLSDHCSSVTIEDTADEVEFTSFGSTYRTYGQGLKAAGISADFFNDEAAGSVAATLQPLYASGGTFPVKVKPDTAGTIVYTMTAELYGNALPAGAVGDADTISVSFKNGGSLGVTRGTV